MGRKSNAQKAGEGCIFVVLVALYFITEYEYIIIPFFSVFFFFYIIKIVNDIDDLQNEYYRELEKKESNFIDKLNE